MNLLAKYPQNISIFYLFTLRFTDSRYKVLYNTYLELTHKLLPITRRHLQLKYTNLIDFNVRARAFLSLTSMTFCICKENILKSSKLNKIKRNMFIAWLFPNLFHSLSFPTLSSNVHPVYSYLKFISLSHPILFLPHPRLYICLTHAPSPSLQIYILHNLFWSSIQHLHILIPSLQNCFPFTLFPYLSQIFRFFHLPSLYCPIFPSHPSPSAVFLKQPTFLK